MIEKVQWTVKNGFWLLFAINNGKVAWEYESS